MTNLAPLFLDKTTGELVATSSPAGSSGFTFIEHVGSTTWTINHNKNNIYYLAQVYDLTGMEVIPDLITTTDSNTVTITFGIPQTGMALLLFFM